MLDVINNTPKTVTLAWVKNVNKLRVHSSKTGAGSSPTIPNTMTTQTMSDVQLPFMNRPVHFFNQLLSTGYLAKLHLSNLTYTHFPQGLLLGPQKIN